MRATIKQKAAMRAYYLTHRAERIAYTKAYAKAHPDKAREHHRNRDRAKRLAIITLFGGKCITCGFSDIRALQLDHIHGGGNKDRKAFKNTWGYMQNIINNPAKYQLLCANCNWIKRYERGEH